MIGQAGDAASLAELVRSGSPDLAVVDIRMPPTHTSKGIDVARAIRAEFPSVGILLLSAHVELETAIDLVEGGRADRLPAQGQDNEGCGRRRRTGTYCSWRLGDRPGALSGSSSQNVTGATLWLSSRHGSWRCWRW